MSNREDVMNLLKDLQEEKNKFQDALLRVMDQLYNAQNKALDLHACAINEDEKDFDSMKKEILILTNRCKTFRENLTFIG